MNFRYWKQSSNTRMQTSLQVRCCNVAGWILCINPCTFALHISSLLWEQLWGYIEKGTIECSSASTLHSCSYFLTTSYVSTARPGKSVSACRINIEAGYEYLLATGDAQRYDVEKARPQYAHEESYFHQFVVHRYDFEGKDATLWSHCNTLSVVPEAMGSFQSLRCFYDWWWWPFKETRTNSTLGWSHW